MRWLLILLLCAVCAFAIAQDDAAEASDSASATQDQQTEVQQAEVQPAPEAGEASNDGSIADAVEESVPPQPPEDDSLSDLEFEPGEEISEDYPVPLPSDI